jgi:hypothetical protein
MIRFKVAGKQHQAAAKIPIALPDPVPKKTWRKKDAHGKTRARALTAAEIAERDLKRKEQQDKKQRKEHQDRGIVTPESVLQSHTDENMIVSTTPERPPASTAPARLGITIGAATVVCI